MPDIIADSYDTTNDFPRNLTDIDSYSQCFNDVSEVIAYIRTSPSQNGSPRSGDYQLGAITRLASKFNLKIVDTYQDLGAVGTRIGEKTRPQFMEAIRHAQRDCIPITGHDFQRFCRRPQKLARYRVTFVSIAPLSLSPSELRGQRIKEANQFDGDRMGGRVQEYDEDSYFTARILRDQGYSLRGIARELHARTGAPWDHNKVKRLLS